MKKVEFLKKFTTVSMAVLLALSATACFGDNSSNNDDDKNAPEATGEYIVKNNGTSEYTILVPERRDENLNLAISDLQLGIKACTGYEMKTTTKYEEGKKYISVGETVLYEENKEEIVGQADYLPAEKLRVLTVEDDVIIVGGESRYTAYAVEAFMEQTFGFKWYTYDDYYVEKSDVIPLLDFDYEYEPVMKQRILYQWDYWVQDVVMRNRRMKTNGWGEGYFAEGHNMISNGGVLYKGDYKDEHPEWFSMPYGGYDYHDMGQLCVTNEEATAEFIRRSKEIIMEKWGDGSNSYFMIGMQDCWGVCTCETCTEQKAINGTDAGNFIVFTNKVARAINEWVKTLDPNQYPTCTTKEIYFPIYAYFYNEAAPVKYVNGECVPANENVIPDEHVIIMYAPLNNDWSYSFNDPRNVKTYQTVTEWLKVTNNMMIYSYCVPYGATGQIFFPFNDLATMGGSWSMAKENNYLGYSEEGSTYYRYPSMQRLKNYVSAQMWWGEREGSVDDFAYEFIDYYYRPIAEEFKAYYNAMKQFSIYQVEVMGCKFRAMSSTYGEETNWPVGAIDFFHNMIEDMLKKLEPLKATNPDLYQMYFDRVNVEKLWTSYAYSKLYRKYFNKEEYLKHVDFVSTYCVEYKVQTSGEVFAQLEGFKKSA